MRFHLGWGDALEDAAAAWTAAPATAERSDLDRGGLVREAYRVRIPAAAHGAARREMVALRWFPQSLLRSAVADDAVTVLQRVRIGPISVDAPVRIVELYADDHRAAIAVVTLAGHPERGVERYELVRNADGSGTLTVDKAWALVDPLARLVAPFAQWFQAYATRRSLRRFRRLRR